MSKDYIPRSDTGFQAWALNFVTYASAHLAELGIMAADMAPVTAGFSDFGAKMSANVTA